MDRSSKASVPDNGRFSSGLPRLKDQIIACFKLPGDRQVLPLRQPNASPIEGDSDQPNGQTPKTDGLPADSIFGNGRVPTGTLHLQGKKSDFFRLPRELRDEIYDRSLDHKHTAGLGIGLKGKLVNLLDRRLLLVSYQFREELRERSVKWRGLILEGHLVCVEDCMSRLPRSLHFVELRMVIGYSQDHPGPSLSNSLFALERFRQKVLDPLWQILNSQQIDIQILLDPRDVREESIQDRHPISRFISTLSMLTESGTVHVRHVYLPKRNPQRHPSQLLQLTELDFKSEERIMYYSRETGNIQRVRRRLDTLGIYHHALLVVMRISKKSSGWCHCSRDLLQPARVSF